MFWLTMITVFWPSAYWNCTPELLEIHPKQHCNYYFHETDCDQLIIRIMAAMTKSDPCIAYLLQVHKNPGQLNKFVEQIDRDSHSDIYIHIDKKSIGSISRDSIRGENIKVTEDSVDVTWGDISQVDATLCLLRALRASRRKYDFIIFKSGQDLLVKQGLNEHLRKNIDRIFMTIRHIKQNDAETYFVRIKWPAVTRRQYDSMLHPCRILRTSLIRLYRSGINLIPSRHMLPANYAFYKGSSWFCIPGDVVEYIMQFLEDNTWYYDAFKNALAPDESFFQTLIMNSPYAANVVNDNLTFLKFGNTYKNNNHAVTLTMKDLPEIEKSGKFFARKFDEGVDGKIIDYFCDKCRLS